VCVSGVCEDEPPDDHHVCVCVCVCVCVRG